ncbi:MAG: DUF5686 and carboxypeptidase regulatory-like domain-containing protein [Bacteroidales bacterium]|nr:DUF5686 and carboxypeptidase regulatory-like domain-containing protein [Bacteroidales bacterium]
MKNIILKYYLTVLILCFFSLLTFSQTKIRGVILNDVTSKPVPFSSVSFVGSAIGCISDENGVFFIEANTDITQIAINNIGFINDTLDVVSNKYQDFIIYLKPDNYNIKEVIITPGENPADIIIKKVIKNKKYNNINRLGAYSYEQYTKMQVDINNINPSSENDPILKDFKSVFAGIDTSAATGKIYMPLIISETLSDFYYKKFPKHRKEIIKAVNFAGIDNLSASKFTGQMYLEFNFYKNYIKILEKDFISPVALSGLLVYDYSLLDSTFIDNSWCYHLSFLPKRKYQFTFKGDMWITDTTFALKKINANMSKTANLGFVSDFYVKKEYKKTGNNFFFPAEEEFFIDFNISKVTAGFFGKKYTSRKNIKLNPEFPPLFFSATEFRDIEIEDNAADYDSVFWNNNRHTQLSAKERNIYRMVDSVTNQPTFKKVENFIYLLATGYVRRSYLEFGPYYKVYSKNAIEGHRLRLGVRTSNDFSKKIELNSYLAFGLDDQKTKYGFGTKYKLAREPWTLAQINYSKDLIQLGANLGEFGSDNIFSISGKNDKLLWIENFEASIERDLIKSITGTVFISHKIINPTDSIRFFDSFGNEQTNITTTELTFSAHFGINEEYVEIVFNRQSLGSLYPILELEYTIGIPDFMNSNYKYSKLKLGLRHHISYAFIGKTNYYIEAGKIWGTVPFPLLKLHEGSTGITYDMYAFNMMNYYEFASDKYISFFAEHHFNGLFLNKIPVLRKLKFREVIYAKGVLGSLNDENRNLLQFPSELSDVEKPYIELGAGIENIVNILSVNYFRRISHLQKPDVRKNGIIIGLQLSF